MAGSSSPTRSRPGPRFAFTSPTPPFQVEKTYGRLCSRAKTPRWPLACGAVTPSDIPFTLDKKKRLGPQTELLLYDLSGTADVTVDENTRPLVALPAPKPSASPTLGFMIWQSTIGVTGPIKFFLPGWVLPRYPPFPRQLNKKTIESLEDTRTRTIDALDALSINMSGKNVEAGLLDELKNRNPIRRALAVRCFGAINDLSNLLDGLVDVLDPMGRQAAIANLRHYIGRQSNNGSDLYDALLQKRYNKGEAVSSCACSTTFSDKCRETLELYSRLIDYLIQDKPAIRVLAHWHLVRLVPWGRNIV